MADPDRGLLEAWPAAEPAPGFADRVLARLEAEHGGAPSRPRARRWPLALGSAALGAAVAVLVLALWPRPPAAPGQALAGSQLPSEARTTLHLGERAVAVAEAGASLTWQLSAQGDAQVVQQTGAVFYRVERSAQRRFAVQTPHGQVVVAGTCFTVEVDGPGTRVWVHEGAVVLERAQQAPARLEAGQRLELGAPRTIARPAPTHHALDSTPPPPAGATEEPKIGHDRATLLEWAKRCQVRADLPPFEDERPKDEREWEAYARKLGATAAERGALAEAFAEVEHGAYQAARGLYVQTLGEREDLEELSLERLLYDISRTAEYSEQFEVFQRLAAERAGLREPPALEQLGPIEQLIREMASQGDRFERALARRLGAARARALRERNRGWPGPGIEWQGCPPAEKGR